MMKPIAKVIGITVVCLIVFATIGLLALYPVNVDSLEREFEPHTAKEFEVMGAFPIDSERYIEYEGAVDANGTVYFYQQSSEGEGYVTERYEENGTVYIQIETSKTESYFVEREKGLFEGEIIQQKEVGDRLVTTIYANESDRSVEQSIRTREYIINHGLGQLDYDQQYSNDSTISYIPQDGWYSHDNVTGDYRVTGATGEIQVDAETNYVVNADIEFVRTHATSYLSYILSDDASFKIAISYDVNIGPTAIDTPEWVEEVRSDES